MATEQHDTSSATQRLAIINNLNIKAFSAKNQQALTFIILNETARLVPYDRAVLWDMREKPPRLLGISGQASVSQTSELAQQWHQFVGNFKTPGHPQIVTEESFIGKTTPWQQIQQQQQGTTPFWIPLPIKGKEGLGLWIERWSGKQWQQSDADLLMTLREGYILALEKLFPRLPWKQVWKKTSLLAVVFFLFLSFFINVPLRIVAPCEVIPNEPVVITAPLNGIIAEIVVKPGQNIKEGDVLVEYDKRVPLQELKVAQKQVQIIQTELNRALTQGISNTETLAEMAVLKLKLQKENIALELAQYHANQLSITSPLDGVVMLDNPDDWKGKPVRVGERIMIVSDPAKTKVRIWIPEDDNVILRHDIPIKVFLNVNPAISRQASLEYIASFTSVNEKQIRGFEAEALWLYEQQNIKMGLKGSAILYGDDVSLFYYIFRKPIAFLRSITGL